MSERLAPAPPTEPSGGDWGRIAVRSTLWVTLGTYLNLVLGFGSSLVLTRLLTPEIFGFFTMAGFWSSLLNLRPKAGLNYSAVRQPATNGELLGTYFSLDLAVSAASLVLAGLGGLVLTWLHYPPPVVLAIVLLVGAEAISSLVSPLSMVLEKEMQLSRLTLVSLVAALVAYVCAVPIALVGHNIWSLLAVSLVTNVISIAGVYWVCRQRWPQAFRLHWRFDRALAGQLLRQGISTGLALTAVGSIVTQFDNFLVGTFVGYTTLGFYDRAYGIAHWPNLLLTVVVTRVGFLTFAKVQADRARLTQAVRLSLWVLTTLGIPMALALVFGAGDLVQFLYGPAWSESALYLRFLVVYSVAWPIFSVGFWLAVAQGHSRTTLWLTATQAAVLVVLGTPMTMAWGVMGTILAVSVSMVLALVLSCAYIFRQVPLSMGATFGPPAIATALAVIVMLVLIRLPLWQQAAVVARLLLAGGVGPGVFLVALWALNPKELMERLRYILQRLRGLQPAAE
jgi:lipopolysaccharide exporter